MGNFEEALRDYLASQGVFSQIEPARTIPASFTEQLMVHMSMGAADAALEFVPNLCSSVYGLGNVLWMNVRHPIQSIDNFSKCCYSMGEIIVQYAKTIDSKIVEKYIDELKVLYKQYDHLSDGEKGALIGYTIGKYGIDIFACTKSISIGAKAVQEISAYRNLRNANSICNMEAMSISNANKKMIQKEAKKQAKSRQNYFKDVKYNLESHHKHIEGHNDFISTRSIWQHPDPEGLLKRFAGTGHKVRGNPGVPGYKEIVDFKEHIGIWKDQAGRHALPTTRGAIHYSKKGAHIVPISPIPNIGKTVI